jgi:hypothetical protein
LPERLATVRSYLAAISEQLDLSLRDLLIWQPPPGFETKLRSALEIGTRQDVQRQVDQSIEAASYALFPDALPAGPEPITLPEAFERLRSAGSDRGHRVADLIETLHQQIIAPRLERVQSEEDPARKGLEFIELCEISQLLNALPRLLLSGKAPSPAGLASLKPHEFEQLHTLAKLVHNYDHKK